MTKIKLALGLAFVIVMFTSCNGQLEPPNFQKGIRFYSFFDVVSVPPANPVHLMSIPPGAVIVSGILNFGNIGFEQGPGSPGSGNERSFVGETDKFGISDHKFIRDNADWTIQVNYSFAMPSCGVRMSTFRIPPGGQKIFAVCYLKG